VCAASGVEKIYVQVNGCKFNQAQRAEIIGRDGKWEINELFWSQFSTTTTATPPTTTIEQLHTNTCNNSCSLSTWSFFKAKYCNLSLIATEMM